MYGDRLPPADMLPSKAEQEKKAQDGMKKLKTTQEELNPQMKMSEISPNQPNLSRAVSFRPFDAICFSFFFTPQEVEESKRWAEQAVSDLQEGTHSEGSAYMGAGSEKSMKLNVQQVVVFSLLCCNC